MDIRTALEQTRVGLPEGIDARDVAQLLAFVLGVERTFLLAHPEGVVAAAQFEAFEALVARRAQGEPLQYLVGRQEFYGLEFRVTPAVLIPRPETEHLVEAVELWATQFHDERTLEIADVGTGSGAIAVALATHVAGVRVTATDISEAALAVARENAEAHGCEERIRFVHGDLLSGVETELRFDVITSNPPYIPERDAATMQREVVGHEPHTALFAGEDGMDVYRRLIPVAKAALREGGLLALEIGFGQWELIAELLQGWQDVRFIDDYQGIPRVALAVRA